jgi:hypothetical protein
MKLSEFGQQTFPLFPVQRFVLKVIGGEELSKTGKDIRVTDMFNERDLFQFSEAEYLRYLFNEGRASVGELTARVPISVLAVGRRAGKSVLHGIAAAHAVHKLMSLDSPQRHYGLYPKSRIRVSVVSEGKEASLMVKSLAQGLVEHDEMSKRCVESSTLSTIRLRAGEGYVDMRFKSAKDKGLRGAANYHIGLDELAYIKNARDVYNMVVPSLGQFSPLRKEGSAPKPIESTLFAASTPRHNSDFFHTLFRTWFHPEMRHVGISLRIPTWEMNPTLASSWLRLEHQIDTGRFMQEYGAAFPDSPGVDIEE